jgi:hypothetical protein
MFAIFISGQSLVSMRRCAVGNVITTADFSSSNKKNKEK